MSSTPLPGVTEWYPEGQGTQTPPGLNAYMQASAPQITKGQLATFDASGNVGANDGTVPNQIAAGVFDEMGSETSTTAGVARAHFWEGVGAKAMSATASDPVVAADIGGVPVFIATENTIGKLSNASGVKRSFAGLGFGVLSDGLARFWGGRIGQLLARALHGLNAESAGSIAYAQDATASTDQGTAADPLIIPRRKLVGHITSIEIIPSADLALALTNYRVITVYKINTLTNVVGPTVGTFSTLTQNLAKRVPTQFTLSSTSTDLDMLETDVLGYASLHTAGGATIPQSIIRANMKVV